MNATTSRPDRPLVVKCTFDRQNKRITFSSARNCSYDLLRRKVEQCFSLSHSMYGIAYKDDDGEVYEIGSEPDLTEAIQYFQAGSDDALTSSAASIRSSLGSTFGSRKITLRVHISVEYDGPSLSDTSSLASLEEYKSRNASQTSFSFGSPSVIEDDSITVSSRDMGGSVSFSNEFPPSNHQKSNLSGDSSWAYVSGSAELLPGSKGSLPHSLSDTALGTDPDMGKSKSYDLAIDDPSAVFERLKLEEALQDDSSSVGDIDRRGIDRGAAWLKDQNDRTFRTIMGMLPEPSIESGDEGQLGGDLALERNPRGQYYYSYTATGSSSASQVHDDGASFDPDAMVMNDEVARITKPRPTSRQLNWLASQQVSAAERANTTTSTKPSHRAPASEPAIPENGIPRELLQYLPIPSPPADILTDCSECGIILDSMRYVCSTCGEKPPKNESDKGKGKDDPFGDPVFSYPPRSTNRYSAEPLSPTFSSSSQTFIGSAQSLYSPQSPHHKPLPLLPNSDSQSTLSIPGYSSSVGYELCYGCIESAGVTHAIEAGLALGASPTVPTSSPSSPEDAQRALQWRRSAPRQKGQLRHAYQEKIWGHTGWEVVEQDDLHAFKCSACGVDTSRKCYKCASCIKYYLCKACYSQVHDMHPSHAFLVVPDKPSRSLSEPDFYPPTVPEPTEEISLVHPGVKCAHCMLDIVGARFHCAICDSVDICSNCESAGLPGNLDSDDTGHSSSHIMIKIPYPLERTELQTASKRAMYLWTGRDAPSVLSSIQTSKATSEVSYARTIVGNAKNHPLSPELDSHSMFCNACNRPIMGTRYQCAHCSSLPTSYSLCSHCEERSFLVHDPNHVFFKLPRPVDRQIESQFPMLPRLYKIAAGPPPGTQITHPNDYLKRLVHSSALCDRCMTCIQGCWFRCAYCGLDLCDACEEMDTHNDSHVFLVFKSLIDMGALKNFADVENPSGGPPVIPYSIYH